MLRTELIERKSALKTPRPITTGIFNLTLPQISAAIVNNSDVSGGNAEIGRRSYQMRFEGEFEPEELDDLVIVWREGRPVLTQMLDTFSQRTSMLETRPD